MDHIIKLIGTRIEIKQKYWGGGGGGVKKQKIFPRNKYEKLDKKNLWENFPDNLSSSPGPRFQ